MGLNQQDHEINEESVFILDFRFVIAATSGAMTYIKSKMKNAPP
jgi:hypothetical protein